jgi:RsiW-degrading membrane proteinase PrsW (M82 family)
MNNPELNVLMVIVPIVLPVIFWAAYHYYKDRHMPEPVGNLVLCFGLGILSFYVGKLMYLGLGLIGLRFDPFALAESSRAGLLAYSVLAIGGIEELAKLLPFLIVVLRLKAFDEPVDGIIYAAFIALGFASVENIQYLQYVTGLEMIGRGFASPLVHIMFASIWAYNIGLASLHEKRLAIVVLKYLGLAALAHGIYDFIIIALPLSALPLSALLILAIWLWRMHLIRELHRQARKSREIDG